jgi:hypothetical protein
MQQQAEAFKAALLTDTITYGKAIYKNGFQIYSFHFPATKMTQSHAGVIHERQFPKIADLQYIFLWQQPSI